jgi:hypothetical protein
MVPSELPQLGRRAQRGIISCESTTKDPPQAEELTMATWIWLNIPMMVLAFALTAGIPFRMVLKDSRRELAPVAVADSAARCAGSATLVAA